jgi:hypothetical protein
LQKDVLWTANREVDKLVRAYYVCGWIRRTLNTALPATVLGGYPKTHGWLHIVEVVFGLARARACFLADLADTIAHAPGWKSGSGRWSAARSRGPIVLAPDKRRRAGRERQARLRAQRRLGLASYRIWAHRKRLVRALKRAGMREQERRIVGAIAGSRLSPVGRVIGTRRAGAEGARHGFKVSAEAMATLAP